MTVLTWRTGGRKGRMAAVFDRGHLLGLNVTRMFSDIMLISPCKGQIFVLRFYFFIIWPFGVNGSLIIFSLFHALLMIYSLLHAVILLLAWQHRKVKGCHFLTCI